MFIVSCFKLFLIIQKAQPECHTFVVIYVIAQILLSTEMCSSLVRSEKLIKPCCFDREQQCLLPFYV